MSEFYSVEGQEIFPVIDLHAEGCPTLYFCKIPAHAVDDFTGQVAQEHVVKVEGAQAPEGEHYFYSKDFCPGKRIHGGLGL